MTTRKKVTESEELTYEEVNARYFGEWVLLKITKLNDEGAISHGRVLEHTLERRKISGPLKRFWQREPDTEVAIFFGGMRRHGGEEFRRAIEEAAKSDYYLEYMNARWDLVSARW